MARSSAECLPRLLRPSTDSLQKSKGNFGARPPPSFSGSPRQVDGPDGRSAGTATATSRRGHPSPITPDLPKQPEMPRGILGVSSVTAVRRTPSTPASASATPATPVALDPQRRAAHALRPPQHTFPAMTPSVGVSTQRKKKWRPHCKHPTCLRPASYAEASDGDPVFCDKHKTAGQQNVVHPNRGECESEGCARVSAYASTADTRARFCHLHKEDGMVKVRDNVGTRCEEATCIKQASFAMEGDRYPKFCKDHRKENMINIRNHRCIAPGCSRGASFAASGSRGQFCSEHKAAGMINTRRRNRCIAPGCSSREPIYVIEGQHLPKFCAKHKGPGMSLPYRTPASRGESMLAGCDRALELPGPGEAQPRLCAANTNTRETQQPGPARRPSIDEAPPGRPRGVGAFPAPNGFSLFDDSILAHGDSREKTRRKAVVPDVLPVKKEIIMRSCSPASNGGATPGRHERHRPRSPGQLGGTIALDFDRHRVPPRSPPEAVLGNGETSAPVTSPSPVAALRVASAGGRGGSGGGRMEILEREEQGPIAYAHAAPPPPHVYQALRPAGGGAADPAAAAFGVAVARSSTPSTSTMAVDKGVVGRGPGRDDSAIPMEGEGEGRARARGLESFGSAFPAYSKSNTHTASDRMEGPHGPRRVTRFRVPRDREYYTDGRSPVRFLSPSSPERGSLRRAGRPEHELEQELGQEHRRPVVRLLHMDDPTGAARLPPFPASLSVLPTPPPSPEPQPPEKAPATQTSPARAVNNGAAIKEIGIDVRGHARKAGTSTVAAAAAGREECGGGARAMELRRPHGGRAGVEVEGGSATDSSVDAATATTTEGEDDGHGADGTKEALPELAGDDAAVPENEGGRRGKPRRGVEAPSGAGGLHDTHPPGYSPTPFYFTLVKALTATATGKGRAKNGKRKRLEK
eukprot:g10860.t1